MSYWSWKFESVNICSVILTVQICVIAFHHVMKTNLSYCHCKMIHYPVITKWFFSSSDGLFLKFFLCWPSNHEHRAVLPVLRCAQVSTTLVPPCLATRTVQSQRQCSTVTEIWSWSRTWWSQVTWWRTWRQRWTCCCSRMAPSSPTSDCHSDSTWFCVGDSWWTLWPAGWKSCALMSEGVCWLIFCSVVSWSNFTFSWADCGLCV